MRQSRELGTLWSSWIATMRLTNRSSIRFHTRRALPTSASIGNVRLGGTPGDRQAEREAKGELYAPGCMPWPPIEGKPRGIPSPGRLAPICWHVSG